MRRLLLCSLSLLAILALASTGLPAQPAQTAAASPAAPVPPEFRATYGELESQLVRFEQSFRVRWDGRKTAALFSGELLAANGHVGPGLIRPGHEQAITASLEAFRTLGMQAATVQISFPMLYRPFYRSDEEYAAYLQAYRRVAAEVRARGMKLIVRTQAIFSKGGWTSWDVGSFYPGSLSTSTSAAAPRSR